MAKIQQRQKNWLKEVILGKQYMQKGEEEIGEHSVCVPGWAVNDVIILKFWGIGVVLVRS